MIVEYIRYKIPLNDSVAFEQDYAQAAKSLDSSNQYELSCCLDETGSYDRIEEMRHYKQTAVKAVKLQ